MPVKRKRDNIGTYYQYGNKGHKYYYTVNDKELRDNARMLAIRQGQAIHASQHRDNR